MSKRQRSQLPAEPLSLTISGLSHDGRGVASVDGKRVFVDGALPGEQVLARLKARLRRYDEAAVEQVLSPSPHRVQPRCPHFGYCGGCVLQHMEPEQQLLAKQEALLQSLERIGQVQPQRLLEPLAGPAWNYRRKARLSVRHVPAKGRVLVGFRERQGRYVADMQECHVVDLRVAGLLPQLSALIGSMQARERIPQVEVSCGDEHCALVFRHLEELSETDQNALRAFARQHRVAVMLQPSGPDSIRALEPAQVELSYALPEFDVVLGFGPADFIQVNAELNRAMVRQAIDLLEPGPADRVLDLFCGLGNFTLPLARRAGSAVGVEGDATLVARAVANAALNGIANASFHLGDLSSVSHRVPWLRESYDAVLLDPPRSGAEHMLHHIAASGARRVVYVSCHPGSLARDAGILVQKHGFVLEAAGAMDMFPHTGHVESMALFTRRP